MWPARPTLAGPWPAKCKSAPKQTSPTRNTLPGKRGGTQRPRRARSAPRAAASWSRARPTRARHPRARASAASAAGRPGGRSACCRTAWPRACGAAWHRSSRSCARLSRRRAARRPPTPCAPTASRCRRPCAGWRGACGGLHCGTGVFGAVGSGKTSCCMYPFAKQVLGWHRDSPDLRPGGLVLEVKGDFCHQLRRILEPGGRGEDYIELSLDGDWCTTRWNRTWIPIRWPIRSRLCSTSSSARARSRSGSRRTRTW